jgi:ubiquinone/menaquinone biosynthesis C-methylase UbiE
MAKLPPGHRSPCAAHSDPWLAAIYEHMNPWGPDLDFRLSAAGARPLAVLDVGCGMGRLAAELARRGRRVTGADPSPGMLAVARRRDSAERVRFFDATAASLDVPERLDLINMTGHAFQAIIHDDDISASLANIRRHLAPGGRFCFEPRNPLAREWDD